MLVNILKCKKYIRYDEKLKTLTLHANKINHFCINECDLDFSKIIYGAKKILTE